MNSRRFAIVSAALRRPTFLAGFVIAGLAGFGSADIDNSGALPIMDRGAPAFSARAELADASGAITIANSAVDEPDVATTAEPVMTGTTTDTTAATAAPVASVEPDSMVVAALTDPAQVLPPETAPVQVAPAHAPDSVPGDAGAAANSIEILDECLVAQVCVDRYLWALYQRTPKEDSIKEHERRKVTVKRRGRTVTVTRTFTKLVDEDFTWKDPKAAARVGMPMTDYVIGGMDRSFRLRLFHLLHAAEQAGLSPGITSAFRDDYRQSLASGLRAATDR